MAVSASSDSGFNVVPGEVVAVVVVVVVGEVVVVGAVVVVGVVGARPVTQVPLQTRTSAAPSYYVDKKNARSCTCSCL
jgi:hypothetical protein